MATTKFKYSPSVNIVRDGAYTFNYINTPNTDTIFTSILNDAVSGTKGHLLIGAYGTGKSSFLLALKQTLEKTHTHFKGHTRLLNSLPTYKFISIVGEYSSLEEAIAKRYKLGSNYTSGDVIKAIDRDYVNQKKKGVGLCFLIDEFGKFLEYAAKNNPESELYFIQNLIEWVNDSTRDALVVATLHQDFSAYAIHLSKSQRIEWNKVKGRLKDLPFNEPVEQLLYLAAERINQKFPRKQIDRNFDKLFEVIRAAKAFPLRDYFDKETAKKLYPFDILSAAILTMSLQRYGQNERSLFSFIEANDHLSMQAFEIRQSHYYAVPKVYDYLLNSYYNYISTKNNPNYQQWSNIRTALEKIDGLFPDEPTQEEAEAIIKTIGLLNIFSNGSAKLEPQFYISYSKYSLGIKNPEEIIRVLTAKLIIRYIKHSFRYAFVASTDLDIEFAIDDAGRLVEKVTNVVNHLNQYFEFPFISAKAAFYKTGTPRFFQFKLTEAPIQLVPEGEVDGFINLVFSEDEKMLQEIELTSRLGSEAILYGFYKNTAEVRNIIFEIKKIEKVKESNKDDKIAVIELNLVKEHYVNLLNHYVIDSLYSESGNIVWISMGQRVILKNRQSFNKELTRICEVIYSATPVYKNELVNKTKVSGQVALARKRLLDRLIKDLHSTNLGFTSGEFPPEKSIYLTLLQKTGIHQIIDDVGILQQPVENSFRELWLAGETYLQSTLTKERKLDEFISILLSRPFKLKQGFVDIWVPIFLLAKSDEFALYEGESYVQEITPDILELLSKKPGMFAIKAFDLAGIKLELFNRYRIFLNQSESHKPTNKTFIQTIRPFLTFYKSLPDYAKQTNRLTKKSLRLRSVITTAKDPEKAFFDDFPTALGFSITDLQNMPHATEAFITQLQDSVRELRGCYDSLIDRIELYFIREILDCKTAFPTYKTEISKRFSGLKQHLLLPYQKSFFGRLQSALDDKKSWIASISQSVIGKSLTTISDNDEIVLFDRLADIIYELDNLSEISNEDVSQGEEVVKLEITSFVNGINKNLLRIPQVKTIELDSAILKIKSTLGKDKQLNVTALIRLLQQILTDD